MAKLESVEFRGVEFYFSSIKNVFIVKEVEDRKSFLRGMSYPSLEIFKIRPMTSGQTCCKWYKVSKEEYINYRGLFPLRFYNSVHQNRVQCILSISTICSS